MRRAAVMLAATMLAACEEPDYWAFSSTPVEGGGTTFVVVWVDDSPADEADEMFVTFKSVALRGPEGEAALLARPREVEILALRNGRRALLAAAEVPTGVYDALVLRLSTSPGAHRLTARGEVRTLAVGAETVEIAGPFVVRDGTEILVDFNARMSVLGGTLRPVCTAADLDRARFIDGAVLDERGEPVAGAVVSAQRGGEEICSGRTDGGGGFRLGPVADADLTLVATARGRGIAVGTGPLLVLPASAAGALSGAATGSHVRLIRDGALISVAPIDPATAAFTFPEVPVGAYDLEVWDESGRREIRPATVPD